MNKPITMGSLFSGIGGFEVAAQWYDVKVLWQSEIEAWAVELLKHRFPEAEQLGDVCNINGAEIEPVDIITFGSPCQDMSVAGKRAGLDGERSGLFREAMRIIREMRKSTNGEYPKYIIWENVPGAFSSNKGLDFKAVLEEITESKIPMPKSGKWAAAGMVRGGKCDVSWRVLDAQYWGVSQRRKRIYLVGDYRTGRSAEILFKPESVSRHPKPCGEARKGIASDTQTGIREANAESILGFLPLAGAKAGSVGAAKDLTPTLRAESPTAVCVPFIMLENHPNDSRVKIDRSGTSQTLTSRMGTGGGNVPMVMAPCTIDCRNHKLNQNISGTLQQNGNSLNALNPVIIAFQGQASSNAELSISDEISPTLQCTKNADVIYLSPEDIEYIVRRLTPSECAKLQGFPDNWHDDITSDKGKQLPDTAAYKGYGNAVATVCAEYPIANIVEILKEAE